VFAALPITCADKHAGARLSELAGDLETNAFVRARDEGDTAGGGLQGEVLSISVVLIRYPANI
jgi:hypothetical protein